jgi:hypothetical protein
MLICHLFRKCENKALLISIWHGMRGTYQERWMTDSCAIQDNIYRACSSIFETFFQAISMYMCMCVYIYSFQRVHTCPTLFKLISLRQNVNEIEPAQKKQLIISVIVMIVCIWNRADYFISMIIVHNPHSYHVPFVYCYKGRCFIGIQRDKFWVNFAHYHNWC